MENVFIVKINTKSNVLENLKSCPSRYDILLQSLI